MIKTSTCIVGLKHDGKVYIGGDSLGSTSNSGTINKTKKVFHLQNKPEIIVGYTSSYRMGQLLQYSSSLFNDDDFLINDRIDERYLVNTFIPNIQKLFKDGGYQRSHSDEVSGGTFLLGYKDKLYKVQEDYSILESNNDYTACGCGEDFALGSLFTTEKSLLTPEQRIEFALQSASNFSIGVAPPFWMVNTSNMEVTQL